MLKNNDGYLFFKRPQKNMLALFRSLKNSAVSVKVSPVLVVHVGMVFPCHLTVFHLLFGLASS
jgi:hypothetical protein